MGGHLPLNKNKKISPKKNLRSETSQNGQQALSRSGARVGWGVGVGGAPLLDSSLLAILIRLDAEIFF